MVNKNNNTVYNNNNLVELVNFMNSQKDSDIILQDIFDLHFKKIDDNLIQNLILHMNKSFGIQSDLILDYVQSNQYIAPHNISDDNRKLWDCLNILKRKYGYLIENINNKNRNPFALLGMSINIDNQETRFNLKINRVDGESLNVMANASDLLGMITFSSINLSSIIKQGIYNLDVNNINEYIKISNEVSLQLKNLLNGSNK